MSMHLMLFKKAAEEGPPDFIWDLLYWFRNDRADQIPYGWYDYEGGSVFIDLGHLARWCREDFDPEDHDTSDLPLRFTSLGGLPHGSETGLEYIGDWCDEMFEKEVYWLFVSW